MAKDAPATDSKTDDQRDGQTVTEPASGGGSRFSRALGHFERFVGYDESNTTDSVSRGHHSSWYRRGTVRREARATLEKQVAHFNDIDAKAMRTFRFSLLFLGLLAPALTLAVRFGPVDGLAAFYTSDTVVGVICLFSSSALAGVTYTTSSVAVGISPAAIEDARRRNLPDKAAHDALLNSYAEWIRANDRTILWNSLLVTATILLLIYAVVFLALGFASALVGPLPGPIRWFTYVALVVLAALSRLL